MMILVMDVYTVEPLLNAPPPPPYWAASNQSPDEGFSTVFTSIKAGIHVKAVLRLLNTAFLPISQSRFKRH